MEYQVHITEYITSIAKDEAVRMGVINSPWINQAKTAAMIISQLKVKEGSSVIYAKPKYDFENNCFVLEEWGFVVKDGRPYDVCKL